MNRCIAVTKEVLTNPVMVWTDEETLSFETARSMAERKAREFCPDPMLLAWYDRRSARFSPPVECCSEEKPGWIVYAESRGGNITIDVNEETFVFIYRCFSEPEQ
ncbi:MAG: hypothetical protein C4576_15005 [Desulfobacteraceae bacterium]|nr:MAG: hypothetical protein C4576_15005 [Desulfobacteraceae bacterium]